MIVNGNLNFTGTLYKNSTVMKLYFTDDYKHGLNLTKGYIGGGYIGSSIWQTITKIQNPTDSWSTSSSTLYNVSRYTVWSSSALKGYIGQGSRDLNAGMQKYDFTTESTGAVGSRNYGGYNPWSVQEGVGNNPDGTAYGTKAWFGGNANGGYWDRFTFSTETAAALSSGSAPDGQETVGWFDKIYGWVVNGNTTYKTTLANESWTTISTTNSYASTGGFSSPGNWEKLVNTKEGKAYIAGDQNYVGSTTGLNIVKFLNSVSTYMLNNYTQTLANSEQSGVMGQNHGYLAGGYNGNQNAHTDRVDYGSDTVRQIFDAPRALSSGSPMWSGIGTYVGN
jgi:hypothetical protein